MHKKYAKDGLVAITVNLDALKDPDTGKSDEAAVKDPAPGARKREIAVYLPANGALLSAVALMAAGWDGSTGPFSSSPRPLNPFRPADHLNLK